MSTRYLMLSPLWSQEKLESTEGTATEVPFLPHNHSQPKQASTVPSHISTPQPCFSPTRLVTTWRKSGVHMLFCLPFVETLNSHARHARSTPSHLCSYLYGKRHNKIILATTFFCWCLTEGDDWSALKKTWMSCSMWYEVFEDRKCGRRLF